MNILLVIGSFQSGGAERQMAAIAEGLAVRGHRVLLVTASPHADDIPCAASVRRERLPCRRVPLGTMGRLVHRILVPMVVILQARRLRKLVIEHKTDCAIGFLNVSNLVLIAATRGTGVPVIVSDRNNPWIYRVDSCVIRSLKRLLYPYASLIVVQTGDLAAAYTGAYGVNTAIIPNCLVFVPPALSRPSKSIRALGRLIQVKGHDVLIRAFAESGVWRSGWTLTIGGTGPELTQLKLTARRAGVDHVTRFAQTVSDPKDFLSEAGIFVLPSRSEGFPNVLLEAMACGCPSIATACRSGPSALIHSGSNGILVPVDDVNAMAAAITTLVTDEQLRRNLGGMAREVVDRYSKQRITDQWQEMIRTLIRQCSARAVAP